MEVSELLLIMFIFWQECKLQKEYNTAINIIKGMERKVMAEKHILGIKIYKRKNSTASRHIIFLQRYYLKEEKIGIF